MSRLLVQGSPVADWMPLWSTLVFGATVFSGAAALFARQDY